MHRKSLRDKKREVKNGRKNTLRFENARGIVTHRTTTFVTDEMKDNAKREGRFQRD